MIADRNVVAVVAMARNSVIGRDGAMPWHLSSELKRFRRLTEGRPLIMGRRTLESIGRLLPNRDTIVLTRRGLTGFEGARVARNVEEALAIALDCATRRDATEIVIAGGAEIYAAFLDRTDRIELTVVEAEPEGDTFFPRFEPLFQRVASEPAFQGEKDTVSYRTETWLRSGSEA